VRTFDVQAVEIQVPFELAFNYIADPAKLPEWTHAFAFVNGRTATMRTPGGTAEVDLTVTVSQESGTIDWMMTFANGQAARAFSRVIPHGSGRVIYCFVLQAPPVPLEQIEGTLAQQSKALSSELAMLTRVLERHAGSLERVVSQ
jgi:hypothetical protein